jgi:7-carboxy-7-deazaguanine synthase
VSKYRIKSIFGPTIQGEGTRAGEVVSFVRFAGCNRWSGLEQDRASAFCRFCDTDFRGGAALSEEDIVGTLNTKGPHKRVVLSGGEPTLQIDEPLLRLLKQQGYEIHLETNGSRKLEECLPYFDHITVSPKQNRAQTVIEETDALKLLYPLNYPNMLPDDWITYPALERFLQPIMERDLYDYNLKSTVKYILDNPGWRLSLQTHKILGVE